MITKFSIFFGKNLELYFFCRSARGPKTGKYYVFVDMFVFLFLCREERKGDSFNCTVFDLPANCTAKYTSPSAEFWTYVNSIFIGFYSINKGLNIIVLLGSDLYGGSQTLQTPLQLLLKQEQDKSCLSNVVGQEIDLTRNRIEIAHSHSHARIQTSVLQARFKQFFCHCYLFLKSCVLIEIMLLLII